MDLIINIFIGVVAGIITYIIIGVAIKIFREIIIPWFQTEIYRGHNIKGEWQGYNAKIDITGQYTQDIELESDIIIKQQGNKISGELLLTKQPTGEKCHKLFQLDGSFVDTILALSTKVKDSNTMGTGGIIMKLTENGTKLKGKHTYISAHDWSTVATRDQVWIRKMNI